MPPPKYYTQEEVDELLSKETERAKEEALDELFEKTQLDIKLARLEERQKMKNEIFEEVVKNTTVESIIQNERQRITEKIESMKKPTQRLVDQTIQNDIYNQALDDITKFINKE